MAYREWGPGAAPPLLLIHGITGSSLSWWRVGPALADQFHVVAIDQKGHGDSWKAADGYRYLDQAREAAAFCNALGLEQPAVIGHSWGGGVGLALATSTDLAVSRLVLEDPALGGQQTTAKQHEQRRREFLARVGLDQAAAEAYARSHRLPWWSDEDAAARIDAARKGSPTSVAAVLDASDRDGRALLGQLRCPTLLLRGEPGAGRDRRRGDGAHRRAEPGDPRGHHSPAPSTACTAAASTSLWPRYEASSARVDRRPREGAEHEQADHPRPLTPVRLEQLEHPLIGAARLASQRPGHQVWQMQVAHAHRVWIAERGRGDTRRRPRPDAGHRLQSALGRLMG